VETRRFGGKVRHEHIASLGSIETPLSVPNRVGFWRRAHERLAKAVELDRSGDAEQHSRTFTPRFQWSRRRGVRPRSAGEPRSMPLTASRRPTTLCRRAVLACTAIDALAVSRRSMPPESRAYRSLR